VFKSSVPGYAEAAFIKDGFDDWGHAIGSTNKFAAHERSACHREATIMMNNRLKAAENKTSINQVLESRRAEHVKRNREYMSYIVESNLFLAKQNIAARAHDETEESLNRGGFLELLKLRSRDAPILTAKDIEYSYTSPLHQNQIYDLLESEIKVAIECQNRPFSIIVDETSDVSNIEQLSFCLRYVDDELQIKERFLGFYKAGNFWFI
jgi:hypothetical protein